MKGFNRLRGVATAGVMGLSAIVAGSARAAPVSLSTSITIALTQKFQGVSATAEWSEVDTGFEINEFTANLTTSIAGAYTTTYITTSSTPSGATNTFITSSTIPYTSDYAYSDAFDGALQMSVDGTDFSNPDSTVDLTDNVLTSDTHVDIAPGIDAQVEYAFSAPAGGSSLGVVRALYSFTNTTGATIATTVNVDGNLGSDDYTTIQASSSGDRVTDNTDMWTYSNDRLNIGKDPSFFYDPGLVITRYGTGASVMPTLTDVLGSGAVGSTNDTFGNDYDLTIPAGATQRIMVFIEAHSTNAGAIASAANFESLAAASAAGHLAGLSSTQVAEIVNFGEGGEAPPLTCESPGIECDGDKHTLSMSSWLFGLFGLLPFLRSRRKTKA